MVHKKVASLDTNMLLRAALGDVPKQAAQAEAFIKSHDVLHIADAALYEMIYVLEKKYHMVRQDVAENIYAIIHNPKYICNKIAFERALSTYVDNAKVSFVDCLLVTYAELNHATPLATFDQALVKANPSSTTLLQ